MDRGGQKTGKMSYEDLISQGISGNHMCIDCTNHQSKTSSGEQDGT